MNNTKINKWIMFLVNIVGAWPRKKVSNQPPHDIDDNCNCTKEYPNGFFGHTPLWLKTKMKDLSKTKMKDLSKSFFRKK